MRHNELVIRLRKAIFGVFTQSHNTASKEWHSNFLQNDPKSTKMDVPMLVSVVEALSSSANTGTRSAREIFGTPALQGCF